MPAGHESYFKAGGACPKKPRAFSGYVLFEFYHGPARQNQSDQTITALAKVIG